MDQTPDNVVAFPASLDRPTPLASRGIEIVTPTAASDPDFLVPFYERATGSPVLFEEDRREFVTMFRGGRSVRRVAVNASGLPLGFSLAVPVATAQDLANALRFNRIQPHVRETVSRGGTWALVVAVTRAVPRFGIGRDLVNSVLAGVARHEATRFYATLPSADTQLYRRLLDDGFSADGTTSDDKRYLVSHAFPYRF